MSEEVRSGGAVRYIAMVACVLLGGFVYVGWRIQKGDALKQQHTLAAGIEKDLQTQGLELAMPEVDNPRIIQNSDQDVDDLLSGLTIGSEAEESRTNIDTPDDIDIEALLNQTEEVQTEAVPARIGGVAGENELDILLPQSEAIVTAETVPAQVEAAIPVQSPPPPAPITDELLSPSPFTAAADTDQEEATIELEEQSPPVGALGNISFTEYRVKRGDTLSKIALKKLGNKKRAREIYTLNKDRMSSPDLLRVGMKLRIPAERDVNKTSTHRITTTDSLPSIAMRYYGSAKPEIIEGIRLANPILSKGGFREGTRLTLPPLEVVQQSPVELFATTPAGRERVYVVRPGDTLSKIAARAYGNANNWRSIFNANKDRISKPSAIRVGMTLRLP